MDAETTRFVGGLLFGILAALIGVLYWDLRKEDTRLAKNIHGLRDQQQKIVNALAKKGIYIENSK